MKRGKRGLSMLAVEELDELEIGELDREELDELELDEELRDGLLELDEREAELELDSDELTELKDRDEDEEDERELELEERDELGLDEDDREDEELELEPKNPLIERDELEELGAKLLARAAPEDDEPPVSTMFVMREPLLLAAAEAGLTPNPAKPARNWVVSPVPNASAKINAFCAYFEYFAFFTPT